MPNKCCVTGCKSNYKASIAVSGSVTCFSIPKDPSKREKWLRKIPREGLDVTDHTVICIKHFRDYDVIKEDILPGRNGEPDIMIPRKYFKLKKVAVPCIFPGLPSYLSSEKTKSRESPSKRRKKFEEHQSTLHDEWLNEDIVHSFSDLCNKLVEKCNLHFLHIHKQSDFVFLYEIFVTSVDCPSIKFCIRIDMSMKISVWVDGVKIPAHDLAWLNLNDGCLQHWSQLMNLLTRLHIQDGDEKKSKVISDCALVEHATNLISQIDMENGKDIRMFLIEQLRLSTQLPKLRRYSCNTIIAAFTLKLKSSVAYEHVRETMLTLPSSRLLRKFSCNVCDTSIDSYLSSKVNYLQEKELFVNVLLDEIHVKPCISYKNSKLTGVDSESKVATTVHCFMIPSLFSSNKDVLSLIPAKNLPAEKLLEHLKSIFLLLSRVGFKTVSIITDGNRINKKLFCLLSNSNKASNLPSYVCDPVNPAQRINLLFDSVHILKCVRNNWLNLKNYQKTFTFPEMVQPSFLSSSLEDNVLRASFADLEYIYLLERHSILKKAPTLCWKALHPHALERQSVKLALKIFSDTNVAALKSFASDCNHAQHIPNWMGTSAFISYICRWWSIVNVHHPYAGRNTRNADAYPLRTVNDQQLDFLTSFADWLDHWAAKNKESDEGFVSTDTYVALRHTSVSLVELTRYLLTTHNFNFILTGKFQTDNLESRFGQYCQMSGGNRLVSVQEILENERKLKIKGVLHLYASTGAITIKEYLSEFSSVPDLHQKVSDVSEEFVNNFPYDELRCEESDMPVLLYVAGYAAKKVHAKLQCYSCKKRIFHDQQELSLDHDDKVHEYFKHLERGGLTYPSSTLLHAFQLAYSIFNLCISRDYEDAFVKLNDQKVTFLLLNTSLWVGSDDFDFFDDCSICTKPVSSPFLLCVNILGNLLLNNYTKAKNDDVKYTAVLSKRVAKFSN